MYPDDSAVSLPRIGKETFIPALIGAVVCVFLMRAGFFAFFFMVPLGVCAVVYGPLVAWLGCMFSLLGNGILAAGISLRYETGLAGFGLEVLYFAVFSLGFTWIMAGSPAILRIPPIRTVFRFIAAAVAGALVFLAMIFSLGDEETLSAVIRSQMELIIPAADTAQQALMERMFAEDRIIRMFITFILRGGALISAFFLLFFNRQTAFIIARLFPRYYQRQKGVHSDLTGFYVPRKTIGVLSACIPVILLCRFISLETVEIAAWNLLAICAILFFAQGGGIVLFNLARRPMSMILRLLCMALFVFVIFSPGLNMVAVAALLLLGIAENWLPLRTGLFKNPVGS
jgi:hypothetical protein